METLLWTGVLTVPENGADPRFTEAFATAFTEHCSSLRGDRDGQRTTLAATLERESDEVVIDDSTGRPFAVEVGTREPLGQWASDAALLADAAAAGALSDVAPEFWRAFSPGERGRALIGLRALIQECPECGGAVRPVETTVDSCCVDQQVYAVRCADCETRLLEIDAGGASAAV
jgi:hypothetical protein